jgi:hypothetical protein
MTANVINSWVLVTYHPCFQTLLSNNVNIGATLGRFRTSTKTITITNTSSLCGYVRANHDVISRHFVQTSS